MTVATVGRILSLAVLMGAASLSAMPTAEELAEVKPLVAELIKPDMDAMRAGKKSKSDAAKASMALVSQAETPAAKLLLTRNAFQLYMKGGDYDAADAALDAMLAAVPDYPADELQELLEKALYPVPSKKAPQIRARVVALKQKAAAATQLKKVLALLEKTPDDPALNLRLGTVYALQNDWKRAAPAFAKGSDAALAKAAKAELDLEISPAKAADLYWSVELPKKDAQLQSSLRAHAADLYKLSLPDLTGLTKVQAERRIKEVESVAVVAQEKPATSSTTSSRFTPKKNAFVHFDRTFVDLGQPSVKGDQFDVEFSFDKGISGVRTFLFGVSPGGSYSYFQKSVDDKLGPGCVALTSVMQPGKRVKLSLVDGALEIAIDGSKIKAPSVVMGSYAPEKNLQIGGYGTNNGSWQGNVYSFVWSRGGKVLMELYPFKDGNRGVLKDKVSGKVFAPRKESSPLVYGAD